MFCVELARPEDSVHWLRNQEEVMAGGRVAITTEGTCHTLTISKCSLEDMGEVTFMAGDCRTTTQFFVSGKGPGSAPWMDRALPPSSVHCAPAVHSGLLQRGLWGLGQRVTALVSLDPWFVCCPPSLWSPQVSAE